MNSYEKDYQKRLQTVGKSFIKAIKTHCFQCCGYNMREANKCTNKNCALFILKANRALKHSMD